ncbi:Redoxin-domain-containing protein [Punctularia strigosozonata HHB-11173 SS5]|uniref:Redoxin-domain-containing protein n=1 Tax=Punctularia strigosozonata (strain HHB-11173) TaxID=741275 RepID=R7S3T0_PUNST|nr:Redoxin-domain-containing protein [Punctularia strigosozonata HHB-11173 SS5]EIN04457.1 Redoxin-domain-containing protein [Punctularia strigosozonata HHB-11173 SS5]
MTSILTAATEAAHSAVGGLLAKAQIQPGGTIPIASVKEGDAAKAFELRLQGKNIIVGVPGAFTGTCIQLFEQFKSKGVNDVFVVAVNDVFVMKAWKAQLSTSDTGVRFIADDKGAFVSQLGLIFDASPLLGSPRSERFVIVADGHTVELVAVEPDPTKITVTAADKVLALL